jgi:hypothetical protein
MIRSKRLVFIALIALGMVMAYGRLAEAGRLGGPASEAITVAPFQSYAVNVTFLSGRPAMIAVEGNGVSPLEVYVYDGDGHTFTAVGRWDRKRLTINVYKQGVFQIEIRNPGPWSNTCIVSTN